MILYDFKRFKMIKIRFLSGFWFGWEEKNFFGILAVKCISKFMHEQFVFETFLWCFKIHNT